MNIEDHVRDAIVAELKRQAEAEGPLKVRSSEEGKLQVEGRIDLDELTMAIVGALAGGP